MWYTTIGVVVSGVVFYTIHSFARPPPKTMTKEWQEATNEYLKVRCDTLLAARHLFRLSAFPRRIHTDSMIYRKNASTPSTVSAARITRARDMCRASLQKHRASSLIQRSRSRRVVFICTTRLAPRYGAFLIWSQVLLHCTKSNKSQVDVLWYPSSEPFFRSAPQTPRAACSWNIRL
jgi:Cytochrome c oxidase subunit IV